MNKTVPTILGSLVLLCGVAACGGPADTATDTATEPPAGSTGSGGPQLSGGDFPGASGEVAAVSGRTMQVQSRLAGQVAVTWTPKTTFTHQVAASLADVEVGACVMVGSDPSGTSDSPATEVAATSVRISDPVDGSCAPTAVPGNPDGGPNGNPDGPQGAPSDLSTEMPSELPSDGASFGGPGRAGGAFGTVTAVTSDGFTVESALPGAPGAPGESSDSPATTETVSVTVSSATSFTTTAETTSRVVKVGVCVDARGDADSTGAVTADTVAVSPKVDGECGGTFGAGNDQDS